MKKVIFIFLVLLIVGFSASTIMIKGKGIEKNIIGSWEKESLSFERVNLKEDEIISIIIEAQDKEISHELIVDKISKWEFDDQNNLNIKGDSERKKGVLTWRLKGRGNILEVKDNLNNTLESYQISELSQDKLVVYVNLDLQVRGIVKVVFRKSKKDYAEKI